MSFYYFKSRTKVYKSLAIFPHFFMLMFFQWRVQAVSKIEKKKMSFNSNIIFSMSDTCWSVSRRMGIWHVFVLPSL